MIKLENIEKTYSPKGQQPVKALRGVSFTFPEKGLVFIVGKSGSGKSTLLNILGMLDSYDSGNLIIDGKDFKNFSQTERDHYRAMNIGFVFQEFHIIDEYNIGKNISLPLEIAKKEFTENEINKALEKVGLCGYGKRKSAEISGGQRQRVAIARAIIKDPKIVLADEPTGSLDAGTGKEIFELLKTLAKDKLVVVISHDIDFAHAYADKIIEIADGNIVDVYEGDGALEVVKILSENEISETKFNEINEMLDAGKKVVLTKKRLKNNEEILNQETIKEYVTDKKPSLPFKSTFKLSMLSLRAKWVRLLFTVVLSAFAIAFFGFADIMACFTISEIMVQENSKNNNSFVNVIAVQMYENDFLGKKDPRIMNKELIQKFDEIGIEHFKQFKFPYNLDAGNLTHNNFGQEADLSLNFFSDNINGVIECTEADLLKLGLTISEGTMPKNHNEILITNYMLEMWKKFGVYIIDNGYGQEEFLFGAKTEGIDWKYSRNGVIFDENSKSITGFSDVLNKYIKNSYSITNANNYDKVKIVGVINFDLTKYQEILNKSADDVTEAEYDEFLKEIEFESAAILNNFFALPGYYNNHIRKNAHSYLDNLSLTMTLPTKTETTGISLSYAAGSNYALSGAWFDDTSKDRLDTKTIFKPGFSEADLASFNKDGVNYDKKQIIIDYYTLLTLLPEDDQEYYHDMYAQILASLPSKPRPNTSQIWAYVFDEIIADYDIFSGTKIHIEVNVSADGHELLGIMENYEVVGIYKNFSGSFYPSQNFYDEFLISTCESALVPAKTEKAYRQLIDKLNKNGNVSLSIDDETLLYSFIIFTPNSITIYSLDSMFKMFIPIFSLGSVLFCLFAALLTYNFISTSIKSRKKDIGILRSLGASGKDVAGLFMFEGVLIAVLKIILGISLCYIGFVLTSEFFISKLGDIAKEYELISFSLRQVILMILATLFAVSAAIIFPIIKIAKKQPVEVIRQ